ncbi:transglutaminase-like cysteine peptidase [Methylophaga sp. OBS1]|uniref:transglutaminase-like cysteine peptidase n=1 Tax=Methylophaga sp. OBS1 TaxID=2991933 RepID=UPI00224EC023|nr:transglutaminase-like cysteine peptidase [Methylophaga sp. OBS1]MCX4191203.1 transglutaminase-like cysteine peptidase [Methylophaga sp. OBS1]MCX4191851.1 transglutaminase-like cysteine peptidase [Methylophaga sp. OBS1]
MRLYRHSLITLLLASLLFALPGIAKLNISDEVLARIESQYNKFARKRVEGWRELVDDPANHDLPEKEKLELVNQFFNSNVQFINDIDLWQKKDYWATPLEMLSIGAGDCEDYSIAKYFTLKELGVDEGKLRITYVKAIEIDQAHMVLTYFETKRSVPLVLDNLITDIKPASRRNDLVPVYSFNGTGLWLAKSRGEGQRVGEASKLSLWNDLERRMKEQALQ